MRVLVTGSNGFIGKNLTLALVEAGHEVLPYTRGQQPTELPALLTRTDAVVHLAGENRPTDPAAFDAVNRDLTQRLCDALKAEHARSGRHVPLLANSSAQAEQDSPYGRSKRGGEVAIEALVAETGSPAVIYRWPGVFGKWAKPNYNTVVATFCHQLARDLPIQVNNPDAELRLVYVDDVVQELLRKLAAPGGGLQWGRVQPEYTVTLGALAEQIRAFQRCRDSLVSERVGTGFVRALYATYVSYLPTERFVYDLPKHGDARGEFVEMLKTPDAGQFSYFTAHPGVTRGGHYHHSKTEKFLVIRGHARFGFRHMMTGDRYELVTQGGTPQIVETVPGWTHDITNIGEDELVVMLWANEIFDRAAPDTVANPV